MGFFSTGTINCLRVFLQFFLGTKPNISGMISPWQKRVAFSKMHQLVKLSLGSCISSDRLLRAQLILWSIKSAGVFCLFVCIIDRSATKPCLSDFCSGLLKLKGSTLHCTFWKSNLLISTQCSGFLCSSSIPILKTCVTCKVDKPLSHTASSKSQLKLLTKSSSAKSIL